MKFEFPDTGEGVTEGKFLEWLVKEGDSVEEDQAVAEVETDKAVIDVPAPSDGVIKELMASPGDTVEVGEVILEIDTGEDLGEAEKNEEETEEKVQETESEQNEEEVKESSETETEKGQSTGRDVLALPKVRKLAEEKGVNLESLDKEEKITEEDVMAAAGSVVETEEDVHEEDEGIPEPDMENPFENEEENEESDGDREEVLATPATRKFARENDIELENVEGTGKGGKITRMDVKAEIDGDKKSGSTVEKTEDDNKSEKTAESGERIELSGIRKTVAAKMKESSEKIPQVTHMDKADITELHELRERKKDEVDVHLTYMPFIMKAASEALKEHPNLNAELDEENDEIIRYSSHDFNIAVDTENGLMVPLVEKIKEKNILDIASDVIEKAEKARGRDLSREEMRNGTFSLTNVGAIGGETFTPLISYPQVAILGIGTIKETAEVIDGEVVPRTTVKLSLSYDHRVVDGADAARFMNTVIENLEDPESMLLRL